jgi:iron complex outermembrane receptor protein
MKAHLTTPKFLSLLVLIFFQAIAFYTSAQPGQGTISGSIQNIDNQPLEGINVGLQGTTFGNSTDEQGRFEIRNVTEGTYTLVASGVGYSASKQNVTVVRGKTTRLELQLNESTQQLSEIVVSGSANTYIANSPSPSLRLQTPILETPQNIQVITGQVLADQQVFDMLEGVSRNVSGVTKLEHWDNYARLNMRGSRIAPFRNGMNVQSSWGPLAEDMSMVERIEFVKGPAGFMMANGEPSGFYNVVTKKPTGLTRGAATLTVGSFDTYRATTDLDGKLSKDGKLLYRLNLMGQLRGSHRDFEYTNRYTIAPVIKYQLNERTSLTAEYTYQYAQMSAIGSAYVFSANGYGDLPRNATIAEPNLDPSVMNDHSSFLILEHKISDNWKVTGQLAYFNYNQVGSSLWIDSVRTNGDLYRSVSSWDAFNEGKFGQIFVNGEVKTGPVSHRILGGLDLGNKRYIADWNQSFSLNGFERFNIYNPVYSVPMDSLPQFDRSRSLRQRAGANILSQSYSGLYLQDELRFWGDRIRLTLAGRLTSAKDSQYGSGTDETVFTPRIGISGSINKQTTVYALYDQAFVPQAGADFSGEAFDPITGNNIEAGLKKDWLGGRWNSTLSLYRIIKNNVLTTDPEHINFSTQLGQTQTQGVEVDVRGEIFRGLNLTLNYAYTDSKVTEDTNPENIGNAVPGATKHVTNSWLSYRLGNGVFKGIGVSLGYQWQLERSSWFIFDGSESSLPDYFRMDGAVSWQNDKFNIALNVNNILNEYLFSGSPYVNYYYWQTEAPRNFRLTLGYKF